MRQRWLRKQDRRRDMDENKEEIQKLRKQVRNLRIAFLLTQIGFLIISIIFQIQYCRMMHYYREIFQSNPYQELHNLHLEGKNFQKCLLIRY